MQINKLLISVGLLLSLDTTAQVTAGQTLIAKGEVVAKESPNAANRPLKRRSPIYGSDVVITGEMSNAQLKMMDGGMIALKPNSELVIAEYQYAEESGQGSVVIELVKGGLRSVTGAIKAEKGDYKLKTPVGSIGIRGTHYELELVNGNLFVAVWDGAIDVTTAANSQVSFGQGEDFSFGRIDAAGGVTPLLNPPEVFESGHTQQSASSAPNNNEQESEENTEQEEEQDNSESTETADNTDSTENTEENSDVADEQPTDGSDSEFVDVDSSPDTTVEDDSFLATDDFDTVELTPASELLAERDGVLTYQSATASELVSSNGDISNFSLSMNIDLDNGNVSTGEGSFEDSGGEWFFVFSGLVSAADATIDLDITYASHADQLADGDINASFYDGIDGILGGFELWEVNDPDTRASGKFNLR